MSDERIPSESESAPETAADDESLLGEIDLLGGEASD
jgi:hypothetical protein